jgi:hypothetical protein
MTAWARLSHWLRAVFFSRNHDRSPLADPELHDLAERVDDLEVKNDEQDRRLSVVEVRVGVRRPAASERDAG